jgi:hypothetical protein
LTDKKILNFDVESAEIIEDNPDSRFMTAKIQAFSSDKNRHGMYCSEETLQRTASTIYNMPVIYNIVKSLNDFGAHADPDKTLIAGFVVPNSAKFERLPDSRLGFMILTKIWKRYAPKVVEILKRESGQAKVSVEMELIDYAEMDNGLLEMKDFTYLGACLLGQIVKEASQGAHIEVLSFAEENEKYRQDYLLEFSSKYKDIDLTIPENIKKNAEKGLSLYKEMGSGATSVSLATARFIGKNLTISPEKVRHVYKYLNSHKNKPKDKKSPDYISWLMHGGDTAYDWAKDLVEKLEEVDNKRTSYFNESENMGEFSPKEELSVKNEKELEKKEEEMASEEPKEEPKEEEKKEEEMSSEEPKEEEKKEEKMSDEEEPKDEEKEETDEEEEKEEEKTEKMSLDSNLDMAALLAMLSDETEDYAKLVASHQSGTMDYSVLCSAMFTKMCKMAEEMKANTDAYMSENQALKEFKTSVEAERFAFEIESTLSEVGGIMPKEEVINAREDSKNFSVETVDAWKNKTKALAFTFAKTGKTEDKPKKVGLPFVKTDTMHSSSPWKR